MNKKSLMLVALLLASMVAFMQIKPVKVSPGTSVYLSPSSITTDPVSTFTVELKVSDVSTLRAWDVLIRWDPRVLRFISATEGSFLNGGGAYDTQFLTTTIVGVRLAAAASLMDNPPIGPYGVNGSGTLMTMTFQCYDSGDPFDITIESSVLMGWPPYLLGDVNFNGIVNVGDVGLLGAQWYWTSQTPGFDRFRDLNRNGIINVGDVGLLGTNWFKSGGKPISHTTANAHVQNTFPVVRFSRKVLTDVTGQRATSVDPGPGDSVLFNATESYAQGGASIVSYTWDFGDGNITTVATPTIIHVFAGYSDYDGYTVNLTVTDSASRSWSKSVQVRIWRDLIAVDIWPCWDDYLGLVSVMPDDDLNPGAILFPTGAYRNAGTLKQSFVARVYMNNTATGDEVTVITRTRNNEAPGAKSTLWYIPHWTYTGIEINDPNMTQTISFDNMLAFVDYDEDGAYTVGGYERPIWDADNSSTVSVGDIDCTAGASITAEDPDLGLPLVVDTALGWVDSNTNGAFDIGERVYYDNDASGTVTGGDYYVWLEEYYYGVVYDVLIIEVPAGDYQFVISVTPTNPAIDLDPTNNVFVFSPIVHVIVP